MMEPMEWTAAWFGGLGLHLKLDGFRLIYLGIAVLMWICSGIFSREYMAHYEKKRRYYGFFWLTFLATAGVFLSADFYTLFLFFEIMSLTSYVWVAFDEKAESLRAAQTYLAVAVIGGLVLLMGIFLLYDLMGTLDFQAAGELAARILREGTDRERGRLYGACGLMLVGFGAKAGCFPLHIWLPAAHPVAPAPASALLSGILTKAGVFGVILLSCRLLATSESWGMLIVVLGLLTMVTGAVLALFSVNLKRTLACSSVSQIGFILVGIGMAVLLASAGEDPILAVRGAFLHMVNHSLFKLVLFLCAGVVFMNLHELELNEIRGFGRNKPFLMAVFLMGALGISGVPMWSGYISKTLIHEAMTEYTAAVGGGLWWQAAEWIFLISGGMTTAYMLKLFVVLFVDRHPVRQEEFDAMASHYMTPASRAAVAVPAILLPIFGVMPHHTLDRLAFLGQGFFGMGTETLSVNYLSLGNLQGGAVSLGIGILLYVFLIRGLLMETERWQGEEDPSRKEQSRKTSYVNRWPGWLDLERYVYRPLLQYVLPGLAAVVCRAMDHLADSLIYLARQTTHRQLGEPKLHQEGNWIAHILGELADGIFCVADILTGRRRRKGARPSAVGALIQRENQVKHTFKLVEESFSYGLMMVCLGLCVTLGYILWVFMR